jgi:hypothetical protein
VNECYVALKCTVRAAGAALEHTQNTLQAPAVDQSSPQSDIRL